MLFHFYRQTVNWETADQIMWTCIILCRYQTPTTSDIVYEFSLNAHISGHCVSEAQYLLHSMYFNIMVTCSYF